MRTTSSWPRFERALAEALPRLANRHYLLLEAPRGHAYVQFAGFGRGSLRAEAVSNHYLDARHKLDRRRHLQLLRLGWEPPTNLPPPFQARRDRRSGSPNFHLDREAPVPWASMARLAVATLRRVHGVERPALLRYHAFASKDRVLDFPELGLRRVKRPAPRPALPPPEIAISAPPPTVGFEGLLIVIGPDGDVTVQAPGDALVARFHGTREEKLAHALLLVRGNALRHAVGAALAAFELLAARERGPLQAFALELVPLLQASLARSHPDVLGTD